ncbi:MAG: rhamnan synthesis F family protein [Janthinobacterium lividum]
MDIETLASEIRESIAVQGDYGAALLALQFFVERVIFDPTSVAKVFASLELDMLCKAVAVQKTKALGAPGSTKFSGTFILATELSKAGGHNELIKDIVRLKLFPEPVSIVLTDCFERHDDELSKSFAADSGIEIRRAEGRGLDEKFSWLVDFLRRMPSEKILLLAHNQDSLAVSAAFGAKASAAVQDVVYVHHGDHHLSLGAATSDFVHVDPHNIGYFHCRNELGNRCNHYWPLTVNALADHVRKTPFIAAGMLTTCSSGRMEKFEAGSYLFDYFELIPIILGITGGTHVHIGNLLPARLLELRQAMSAADIDVSRFIHVPWVPSVARALLDHEVDLYISSFPLGGGKAALEAMASGIPLLMHQSYRSRFHGGVDIAYPGAFVWRNVPELLEVFARIDAGVLADHSVKARQHYETFHRDEILADACDFDVPQNESIIPPLTDFRSDELQCFLDDERRRSADSEVSRLRIETQLAELQVYEAQAQEFHVQLTRMTAKASAAETELERFRSETNNRTENNLRAMERDRQEISDYRFELASHRKEFEKNREDSMHIVNALAKNLAEIQQERDAIAGHQEQIAIHRAQIESDANRIAEIHMNSLEQEAKRSIDEAKRIADEAKRSIDEAKRSIDEAKRIADEAKRSADEAAVAALQDEVLRISLDRDSVKASSESSAATLLAEIHALRASTSWRVTKPLRLVSRFVRKGAVDTDHALPAQPVVAEHRVPADISHVAASESEAIVVANEAAPNLPADFVGSVYLKLNPDLQAAGVDAAEHFLSHGQRENRRYALPDFNVTVSERFDATLRTVLLVSHEASRTGAPILSLNLAQTLARKYNVVVLLLGGGALIPAFEATGATVLTASAVRGSPFVAHYVITQICERFEFDFALVNSIESRPVLPVLAELFVPTVSLVHEFASYTRPREAFREALQWSSEVVFSANVTKDNAFSTFPELAEASATVLPQGKCILPPSSGDLEAEDREGKRLQQLIRPKHMAAETLIVLGAGFVQLRKGVDLFIECASRVKRRAGARKLRFVWIGNGYDPDLDVGYSVYLHDQIRRAGLTDDVVFLGETSAIEAAYEVADLFLLSSRLDPLPNVAIDAMSQGVPVLCFDKTTGIADFLHDVGLGERCVAGYLDTDDIAAKILGFADSRAAIAEVGAECRARAGEYFNMTNYVARLETLAHEVRSRVDQEAADCRTILEAGVLRPDFADMQADAPVQHMVRRYVRTWACGIGRRKPFPGFHPGIYLERHGVAVAGGDPLADYLRAGEPQGAWNYTVITPEAARADVPVEMRVALHVHAYYVDLLPEIIGRLAANRQKVDLFISVTSDEACAAAQAHAAHHLGRVVTIRTVPNRGRDIGPFFTEFLDAMKDDYDLVGHFHTKKSVDIKDGNMGKRWFSFLADNLLGNASCGMLDVVVDSFDRDRSIGMVFADDPYISGMETNRRFAEPMSDRLGIHSIPEYFIYPVGTMFWARPAALQPIADLKLQWDDYPPEPLPYDGSMLHALERLIALAVPADSWKIATTNMNGVTR